MGIRAQWSKPWTITTKDSDFSTELQNILDEQFNPDRPNTVWCSDITYIWTIDGFVYLTSIMDLFSRKIIAWTLSETLEVSCVIDTINKAKTRRNIDQPLIIHSDRGSQYVATEYKKATENMQRSYSKKAFPWDNACIESFHSIIKREWLNRFKIRDYKQAYCLIFEMSRIQGMSNLEIAEKLDISVRTVERQIYLSLLELKKIVYILFFLHFI